MKLWARCHKGDKNDVCKTVDWVSITALAQLRIDSYCF